MMLLLFMVFHTVSAAQFDGYNCEVNIIAKDLPPPGVATFKIVRPVDSHESHGGTPLQLSAGVHKVGLLADGKWRGLIWEHDGQMVAQVLTAGTEVLLGNHVMILYNPRDPDELVNMVCDPIKNIFPNE